MLLQSNTKGSIRTGHLCGCSTKLVPLVVLSSVLGTTSSSEIGGSVALLSAAPSATLLSSKVRRRGSPQMWLGTVLKGRKSSEQLFLQPLLVPFLANPHRECDITVAVISPQAPLSAATGAFAPLGYTTVLNAHKVPFP